MSDRRRKGLNNKEEYIWNSHTHGQDRRERERRRRHDYFVTSSGLRVPLDEFSAAFTEYLLSLKVKRSSKDIVCNFIFKKLTEKGFLNREDYVEQL
jgi:hypothetical protein